MSNVLLIPTIGGIFVAQDGAEQFKPMDANAMLVLAERLISSARDTLKAEAEARAPVDAYAPPATYAEIVHALR